MECLQLKARIMERYKVIKPFTAIDGKGRRFDAIVGRVELRIDNGRLLVVCYNKYGAMGTDYMEPSNDVNSKLKTHCELTIDEIQFPND